MSRHRLVPVIVMFACALVCTMSQAQTSARKPKRPPVKSTEAPAEPTDPSKWPLETFTVKGNHFFTAAQIQALSGLPMGKPVAKPDFDAARDRIVASGAFVNVSCGFEAAPDNRGYAATVEVVEVPELYPLHVEDLPVTDAEVLAYAKQKDALAGPRIPGTKEALERYKGIIAELLATKNYHEPVSGKVMSEIPPDLIVLFRPTTARPAVAHVQFVGSKAIQAGILQGAMLDVARGIPYSEAGFRQQLDANIRPLFDAKGYVRVSFPKVTTAPDPTVKGLDVTVEVQDGPVFRLGAFFVTGFDRAKAGELANLAGLKKGDVVNFDLIKSATMRIEHELRREGYLRVSSTIDRQYDDTAHIINVSLRIAPGAQFLFSKLIVVGLDIETEPAIRKMWGLGEGKPFNIDYPEHFLDRVKEGGIFDNLKNCRYETHNDWDAHTVDVTLYFNEKIKPPL